MVLLSSLTVVRCDGMLCVGAGALGFWFGRVRVRCGGVDEVEELRVALGFWVLGGRDNSAAYQPLSAHRRAA